LPVVRARRLSIGHWSSRDVLRAMGRWLEEHASLIGVGAISGVIAGLILYYVFSI